MYTYGRRDLVAAIREKHPLLAHDAVDGLIMLALEEITKALIAGELVSIRGFGSLRVSKKTKRVGFRGYRKLKLRIKEPVNANNRPA